MRDVELKGLPHWLRMMVLATMVILGATPAWSDDAARAAAVRKALGDWMTAHEVGNATVTFFHRGKVISTQRLGAKPADQLSLASLSKVITGMCLFKLEQKGLVAQSTRLVEIFGPGLGKLEIDAPAYEDLTIAELLTHTAGLAPDSTQPRMPKWIGSDRDRHERISRHALSRHTQEGKRGQYRYNNENYAILGAVIEQITGQEYAIVCHEALFDGGGYPSARLSAKWGAYAAWGGWEMTGDDFAKFLWEQLGPATDYGKNPKGHAHTTLVEGVYYGHGTLFRQSEKHRNFWHHGALCFPGVESLGSFFAFWRGGYGVVVGYDKCPPNQMMIDLDLALGRAVFQ